MIISHKGRTFQTNLNKQEMEREIPHRIMFDGKSNGIVFVSRNEAIEFNTNSTLNNGSQRLYRLRLVR